jgi:predicted Zn-dependent protease
VRIGHRLEWSGAPDAGALARPLESPKDFDWGSVYGLWLSGKEHLRQRAYGPAREALEACLEEDPHYVPALGDLALLRHRAMDHGGALDLARRALAIDTYDPLANYAYGLAAARLGRTADARDGFELAAQSVELRSAAWTELARLAIRGGDFERAAFDAERSLDFNFRNLEGRQLIALARRLGGRADEAAASVDALLALDPLSTFGRFEKALASGGDAPRAFAASLKGERPEEVLLELGAWYHGLGRGEEAERVLEVSPPTIEVLYWHAFLKDARKDAGAAAALVAADAASPALAFPFRPESAEVLAWASSKSPSWKPRYLLALVHWGAGNADEARRRLEAIGDAPDFAPVFAARSLAFEKTAPERSMADLERAARLDPGQWRFGRMLVERRLAAGDAKGALEEATAWAARFPESYILGMLQAKAQLANGRAREAAAKLAALRILPYEGATEGRRLHREAHLMLAVAALKKGDAAAARRAIDLARQYPENLGAGAPYPADRDERLEDFLAAQGLARRGPSPEANALLQKVAGFSGRRAERGAGTLVQALALKQSGQDAEGRRLLADWTARDPESALAAWASRAYAGAPGPLPAGAGEEVRALAAWLEAASR